MIHIDDSISEKKSKTKKKNIVFVLVIAILVVILFGSAMSDQSITKLPDVNADTTIIPSNAIIMYTGDSVSGPYGYPLLVYSGVKHAYSSQITFTIYFVFSDGQILSAPIYPVIGQTFKVGNLTYKLLAVDLKVESVTILKVS